MAVGPTLGALLHAQERSGWLGVFGWHRSGFRFELPCVREAHPSEIMRQGKPEAFSALFCEQVNFWSCRKTHNDRGRIGLFVIGVFH